MWFAVVDPGGLLPWVSAAPSPLPTTQSRDNDFLVVLGF